MMREMDDPSKRSAIDFLAPDLEIGKYTHTMRVRSHKLSKRIMDRTELVALNSIEFEKHIYDTTTEEETSGIAYWAKEVRSAQEHGGNYPERLDTAIRAAIGSFLTFSVLIFPHQQILGAVWIGMFFTVILAFHQSVCNHQNLTSVVLFRS